MPRRATRTSFKPGQSGNPKGRPPGIKESAPRCSVKAAFEEVVNTKPRLMIDAIERGLQGRNALGYLDLGAKLLKEIGSGTEAGAPRILLVPGLEVDTFARGVPSRSAPEDER